MGKKSLSLRLVSGIMRLSLIFTYGSSDIDRMGRIKRRNRPENSFDRYRKIRRNVSWQYRVLFFIPLKCDVVGWYGSPIIKARASYSATMVPKDAKKRQRFMSKLWTKCINARERKLLNYTSRIVRRLPGIYYCLQNFLRGFNIAAIDERFRVPAF